MPDIVKFQTLKLNQKYLVRSYSKPFNTKFGKCVILLTSVEESNETFELYSTKLLTSYIKHEEPTQIFYSIVKEKNGTKYPFIEGYVPERMWTVLE